MDKHTKVMYGEGEEKEEKRGEKNKKTFDQMFLGCFCWNANVLGFGSLSKQLFGLQTYLELKCS